MMNLHEKAQSLAKEYRNTESALLDVLMEMQREGLFLKLGFRHLFDYVLKALRLSEAQAYYFSQVARKSREVPELKQAIDAGMISLSQARRIVPVITRENHTGWIEKATEVTQRELEKAVSLVNPQAFIRERLRPVAKDRVELRLGLSSAAEAQLRRAQDLLSQKRRRAVTLEEVLESLASEYLERHDPVRKAERLSLRKAKVVEVQPGRRPISKPVQHAVQLRVRGRCTFAGCGETRWLHLHHKVPVARGGLNTVENLVTLCSGHHSAVHRMA